MKKNNVSRKAVNDVLHYYFDENMDGGIAEQLRKRNIDVLRAEDVGRAGKGIPDPEQLAYATSLGRVIVTRDHHFEVLAYTHRPHAGIIRLQKEDSIGNYIEYLEYAAHILEPEYMQNRLEYYDW